MTEAEIKAMKDEIEALRVRVAWLESKQLPQIPYPQLPPPYYPIPNPWQPIPPIITWYGTGAGM